MCVRFARLAMRAVGPLGVASSSASGSAAGSSASAIGATATAERYATAVRVPACIRCDSSDGNLLVVMLVVTLARAKK